MITRPQPSSVCLNEVINFYWLIQGRIQDFKLGGAYLKKLRRAEGGANIFGVFRVKNHDFMPKKSYFFGCAPPPWIRPCNNSYLPCYLTITQLQSSLVWITGLHILVVSKLNIFYGIVRSHQT